MESNIAHSETLRKDAFGWLTVVFLVIATNGPLTTLVGGVPIGIAMGNGIGLPGSYLLVGILYLLFAAGFTAMSGHVRNAGAFYAYVAHGLGRPLGIGAAFMAISSYNAITLVCYAMIGFFISLALSEHFGVVVPWWVGALGAILVVHYFAYRDIQFSGRVLFLLMLCEVAIIVGFDARVIAHGGGVGRFGLAPFAPSNVFVDGFGPSLAFVVSSYMGFETTAIYAEEVREPSKAIPRATYAAIVIIMLLYTVSVWLMMSAYGFSAVLTQAAKDPGNLWFNITASLMGPAAADVTGVLMLTSLLAALVSFNNTTVRYWFTLGREGVAWRWLARVHPVQKTPHVAATLQTGMMMLFTIFCAALTLDPMQVIVPYLAVPSAVGIVAVQALTGIAVIAFFWRDARDVSLWRRTVAPALSVVGLTACLYQMIVHVTAMTGSDTLVVRLLPWLTPCVALLGVGFAYWLKHARPMIYSRLGELLNET